MYYNSYEEYLRDVLGYSNPHKNSLYATYPVYQTRDIQRQNEELESMYPEIYHVVQPLVSQSCTRVSYPFTQKQLEEMTDVIYLEVAQMENEKRSGAEVKNEVTNHAKNKDMKPEEKRNRPNRNPLRDLIQILILRELLGNQRPPCRPGAPCRPPFPIGPGPGRPPEPPRPPFPRDYRWHSIPENSYYGGAFY